MYKKIQSAQTRRKKAESNKDDGVFPTLNVQARTDAHISQAKLAEMLGINTTTLVNYEKGRKPIKADTLVKYAKICNVSTDYLLGLTKCRNAENQMIHKAIGINEESIDMLKGHLFCGDIAKIKTLDYLLKKSHTKAIMKGFSGKGVKGANDMGLLNLITHYLSDDEDMGIDGIDCITSTIANGSSLDIDGKYVTKGTLLSLITTTLVEYKNDLSKEYRKKKSAKKKGL